MQNKTKPPLYKKIFYVFFILIVCLVELLCLTWGTLALYYSSISPWLCYLIITCYLIIGFTAIWFIRNRSRSIILHPLFWLAFIGILIYWSTIQPGQERVWRADMAKIPSIIIDGNDITIKNYRNFEYTSAHGFIPHYEDRKVQLSHLVSVDFYLSSWSNLPMVHTFLSFNFNNAPPVTISIEARMGEHQRYDPIASLFKQYELIYVVGDEYDIVRTRTNFRQEKVYRYPINISPATARKLFLVYAERINQLATHPEFYNLLSNNCSINIVRYANRIGRTGGLNFRHIINGYIDRELYLSGVTDTSLPFNELKRKAYINDAALSAKNPKDFYKAIRERLPSYNLEPN